MQGEGMNAIDVTFQTEISIENKSTEQLTAEVNVRYHQAEGIASMSAMMLADAGRRLIEIKGRIPHGQFETWCADNLEFSKSKAEKMMKLAERVADENSLFSKTETFTDIGISRIWALLAAPEEVAAEIVETHDVNEMTVRELKEQIQTLKRRVKEEEDKRHEAEMTVFTPYEQEKADMEANIEHMTEELKEYKAAAAELESVKKDLEDAKAKLKKQKEKQRALEAAKDEEIRKGIEESRSEIEKKAREDALTESAAEIAKNTDEIMLLQETVEKLEAEKAKLSNTSLMEFKVLCDHLQDIYYKINDLITGERERDEAYGIKLQAALQKIVEGWRP